MSADPFLEEARPAARTVTIGGDSGHATLDYAARDGSVAEATNGTLQGAIASHRAEHARLEEELQSCQQDNQRLEFRCASLYQQLKRLESSLDTKTDPGRVEQLRERALAALEAQDRVIAALEEESRRHRNTFISRFRRLVRFWIFRMPGFGSRDAVYNKLAACGLFDKAYYLAENKDVATSGADPLQHFILHGALEGRNPSPLFDVSWYLADNPDVAETGVNPLLHYVLHGEAERRRPRPSLAAQFTDFSG